MKLRLLSKTDVQRALPMKEGIELMNAAFAHLSSGQAHVVGVYRPHMQEVNSETIPHANVVIDSRQASLAEAGDLIIPLQQGVIKEGHIHAEIGEIVAGLRHGRESQDEITYFKSVEVAVQDVAATRVGQSYGIRARSRG